MKSQRAPNRSDRPSAEFLRVAALPPRELEAILLRGEPPDPDQLDRWEHRGMNTTAVARGLGIRKFIKGFYKTSWGQLFGFNIPVVQNAPAEPWRYKHGDTPRRFGFYRVDHVDPSARDNAYLNSLLLDYGRGGNHDLDPTSRLRDYIVRVERGADELLLGKALVALGPLRIPVGYFVLERLRPSSFTR